MNNTTLSHQVPFPSIEFSIQYIIITSYIIVSLIISREVNEMLILLTLLYMMIHY
jgi:hypothetical protein